MAKKILPYTIQNNLHKYIQTESEQTQTKITNLYYKLASYCGITYAGIRAILYGTIPSLPLALKIAEYYGVKVEQIFSLVDNGKEEK